MGMSDDQDARIAELERRVSILEHKLADALKVAQQVALMSTSLQNTATEMTEAARDGVEKAVEPYNEVLNRIEAVILDLAKVKNRQDQFEQQSRSTESLLDEFEHKIKPKGKTLSTWLTEIGLSDRYQSVVVLRARRKKR